VNRVTADIATMVAQVPALVEGLTGVNVNKMIESLPETKRGNGREVVVPAVASEGTPVTSSNGLG